MRGLQAEYKPVKVFELIEGGYVDGEKVKESFEEAKDTEMVPRQITATMERRLPEGRYKTGDMKFYRIGKVEYKSGDVIEYKNIEYRINDISEREEGDFTMYMTQRIYDTTREN
jgi:hypothetical protein